jgi:serine/threonine protein kinase/tetratricopeptide (TPR) repeat protein
MPRLDPDRWRLLTPHLDAALELTGPERARWLASLRARDPALADELHPLIAEYEALERENFIADVPEPPAESPVGSPAESPALPASPGTLVGQTVGAYTLTSYIGHGGMGTVWLGSRSDGRFEGLAAVKLLNAALVGRAGEERFTREGTILARLAHPSIAHLIDAGVFRGGQPYLVLEYVQGESIDRYCDDRRLDIHARIHLFLDVLAAVGHAHANLVVHRDIKPSNVLVRTDTDDVEEGLRTPRVKLLDFGIAKLLERDPDSDALIQVTNESGFALTPAFAAPEQLTGGAVTTATDVYALGVLLYLLLGGQHPAGDGHRSPADLIASIVDADAPRLSDAIMRPRVERAADSAAGSAADSAADRAVAIAGRRSTTPDRLRRALRGDLDTIVATALKKDPRERYPSVTAFAADLRNLLARRPISARPDTWTYRTATFVRRHARGVAAAAGVVLLLAGLIAFYTTRLAIEGERARLESERARYEAEKSAKVTELLIGLMTGADPYATRETRGEPTVRALLDAGPARVQKELAGHPELQAEILTVIGRIYQRLGLSDKARPLLEQGLGLARRTMGADHVRVAQSLNDLGVLLRDKSDYRAAIAALEEALAIRRRRLGDEHKDVAVTLVELGRAHMDDGHRDRAEPLFHEALAIRRRVFGEVHRETATSLSELGLLLWERGDLTGAESYLRQTMTITRKVLPDDHPDVSASINNVALVLLARRDYSTAEGLFRQSLAIDRRALGAQHVEIARDLNNLSQTLREQGRHAEAAAALEEAMVIVRSTSGDDHPTMAMLVTNRARIHLARGEARPALPLLERALLIQQRVYRADDWRIAVTKNLLGAALTTLARHQEAEALLVDAHRVLKDMDARRKDAEMNITLLIALYEAWGRPDRAARYRSSRRP